MSNTALLVMDVQPSILGRLEKPDAYLANVQKAVDAAHSHQVPVIYVVVGFRPGMPEISERNKMFSITLASATAGMIDPKPVLTPIEGDVVVTKRRVSAFTGSDLEVVLRAKGITHLVLCGISTSGVVLSTTREAADKDYKLTVLSDLCFDADPEVHAILTEKVFPRQATVQMSGEWMGEM